MSKNERKHLSDALFECYLEYTLQGRDDAASVEKDFLEFLRTNQNYNAPQAFHMLLNAHLITHCLEVANSRVIIDDAIDLFLQNGVFHLKEQEVNALQVQQVMLLIFKKHRNEDTVTNCRCVETV